MTRMKAIMRAFATLIGALAFTLPCVPPVGAQPLTSPSYTREQAAKGKAAYPTQCASCHGTNLDDGEFAPPLKGAAFRQRWGQQSVEAIFIYIGTKMPPARPGTLGDDLTVALVAYLLQENALQPGAKELPADPAALRAMLFPSSSLNAGNGLSAGVTLPPAPPRANPLAKITPVTDALLARVPDGEWLTWRRGHDATGYSPLKAITKDNVRHLRSAWTWSLPNGPNEATPLYHDGVLFVHAFGDKVQALDAATGDLLWQYSRWLPRDVNPTVKRAIAIYGDKLYVPTSDVHIVALDTKTGNVVWDQEIADRKGGFGLTGGPMVAKGKVMIGTNGRAPGGNVIVAFDAATGKGSVAFPCHRAARRAGRQQLERPTARQAQRRLGVDPRKLRCRAESGVLRSRPNLRHRTAAQLDRCARRYQ